MPQGREDIGLHSCSVCKTHLIGTGRGIQREPLRSQTCPWGAKGMLAWVGVWGYLVSRARKRQGVPAWQWAVGR